MTSRILSKFGSLKMDKSSSDTLTAFESNEWDSFVVLREPGRVWFGFGSQRNSAIFCFFFAFVFVILSAGIFLEGEGLIRNLKFVTTCMGGTAALIVALLFAFYGTKLFRRTNRIGMLDLENKLFSSVNQKNGKPNITETTPDDADTTFYGKITIMGPENPGNIKTSPEINVIIFFRLRFEDIFKAVDELKKVADWKGIIGEEMLINLYQSNP